ncbi:MAG: ACT domain-containing protein [Nanoarchaeota archaeon]
MNITKATEQYILQHPSIKDCLRKGMINYSALTRKITEDLDMDIKKNFDAILIACRRFYRKLKKEQVMDNKIIEILKKSKLEVKNKILVAVIEKDVYFSLILDLQKIIKNQSGAFHVIQGSTTITLITADEFEDQIKKLFKGKIVKLSKDLAEVNLKSTGDLEKTPGVMAYLTSLLAENGVNIVETMSTWTDTLFVISEEDIAKVMGLLKF